MTTLCTDPRCVSAQRCQRAEYEDFGTAPGENYGPRCIPALPLASGAAAVYALGVEEGERRATERIVAWLRSEAFVMEFRSKRNLGRRLADVAADAIERGEHRREEGKRLTDAVAEDRAALVAWLRDGGAPLTRGDYEMILRGEHRREEER